MPSATHGTKNIIANRLMAVSERSLIGKSGVYTENNNESRIEGSNPVYGVCSKKSGVDVWGNR